MAHVLLGAQGPSMHRARAFGACVPAVGASGAVAAVMGAYLLLFPTRSRERVWYLIFIFFTVMQTVCVRGAGALVPLSVLDRSTGNRRARPGSRGWRTSAASYSVSSRSFSSADDRNPPPMPFLSRPAGYY